MIDPSMPQSCLENLAQSHDFLVHGVMRQWLAAKSLAFFQPTDTVLVDLARGDFRKHHVAEERDQVAVRTRVLSTRIGRAPLSLRDDVEFAQVQLTRFAEQFPAFQLTVAELAAQLQIPVSCNFLCLRETVFFRGRASILSD